MSNEISLPKAKFGHALDEYYEFLHAIIGAGSLGPRQRLVTMNTITPFSIVKDKPNYNMFVLRAYADLVIRRRSGKDAGSPAAPGDNIIESANSGDAWSFEYFRLAFPRLLQELKKYIEDPAILARIVALETTHEGAYTKYRDEINLLDTQWETYAKASGISEEENPAKYYQKKAEWWRKRRDYVQRLYDKQFSLLMDISDLELAHLDSQGLLFKDLKDHLSKLKQVKLPIRPELEDGLASDPTGSNGDYDQRPALFPPGTQIFNDLLDQENDGTDDQQFQRGYEVERERKTTYSHDTDWNASGSASKFMFLKASLSVAEVAHFEEQIKSIGLIQVGFRSIQEIVIVRGKWYSGAFMKSELFQKWLEQQPEFRDKLQNIITSVIVGRGLTVRLNFGTDIHQNSWRDLTVKGSGGLSVAGYRFGMSGHYHSRSEWDLKDVTKNGVTFADGPNVCRVLGLKVEDVLGDPPKGRIPNFGEDSEIAPELMEAFRSGSMGYNEFIDAVHGK